jgi:aryl-alcohol dehydrogenase-like predicted oxidoreductase
MTLPETIPLGPTGLRVSPLGVGAWSWGDRLVWGYGRDHSQADVAAAFWASVRAGITFFDTAEVYGRGASERLLGQLARGCDTPLVIASKYAPLPWRLAPRAVRRALDASLRRLERPCIDLYQVHWPLHLVSIPRLMDALADAVAEGKVRAVGVSNYSAEQMRRAYDALARRGVPLASNQVEYSLLARQPETNGVLDACRELGATLIAYSPLAMGLLTGKYGPGRRPSGARSIGPRFSERNLAAAQPVVGLLRRIGVAHGDRTPAQVALNWLMVRGTLPIPGAKNGAQAAQNAGALGWSITPDEAAELDAATRGWR